MKQKERIELADEADTSLPWAQAARRILEQLGFEIPQGSDTFAKAVKGAALQFMINNDKSYQTIDNRRETAELQRWVLLRMATLHRQTAGRNALCEADKETVKELDRRISDTVGARPGDPESWALDGLPGSPDLRLNRVGAKLFELEAKSPV